MHEQRLAGRVPRVAAKDAGADERLRVDVGVPQEPVPVAHHAAKRAAREARERGTLVVHLVAEDPEVAGRDAAVLVVLQAQLGKRGAFRWRGDGVSHRSDPVAGCGRAARIRYSAGIVAHPGPARCTPGRQGLRATGSLRRPARTCCSTRTTPSIGMPGVPRHWSSRGASTSRSSCRSDTPPATGVT